MNPMSVSALTTHIVMLFERDETLRDVAVLGEVSNWKRAASGHVYFSLKDSGATLTAVMWRNAAMIHSWLPRDGDQIIASGYVSVYPERGAYQLYVNRIQPAGRGQLYAQFELLKAKLAEQGLFDPMRKRPIPVARQRIGVVTSANAAALRDILRVLTQRWPLVEVVVFPTLVQGSDAPAQIATMLETANRYHANVAPLEVILLARGGGSIEDLWAFNDERVAYALAASAVPTVCGVGHETDVTIADFVADLRAPTPSAAAAAITPDREEIRARMVEEWIWLASQAQERLRGEARTLHTLVSRLTRLHPQRMLDQRRQQLDDRERRLHWSVRRRLDRLQDRRAGAGLRLAALNPEAVLARGYSIVQREEGQVVYGPAGLTVGQPLRVRGARGAYQVRVSTVHRDRGGEERG